MVQKDYPNQENMLLFGVLSVVEAERFQGLLRQHGAGMEKFFNAATCSSGSCGASVEVWVYKDELELVKKALQAQQEKNLSGLNFDPNQINQVFDSSKDTAICPACGFEFSTELSQCPDCGLCF